MFEAAIHPPSWFQEKRVTVLGLGLFGGGRGAVEFLVRHGAYVTITDLRSERELAPSVEALGHLPVRWALGAHREEDILSADLVIPSPAVPRDSPWIERCRARGVPLETEMNLFFKYAKGRIAAVTGSNGKTTTTSLLGAMARGAWPSTRVGGNLGRSLLPEVETIREDEWVVLELSSFQLEDLASLSIRPEIAVITNLSPNHLDRHGSYEAYLDAKREIIRPQTLEGPPGTLVVNAEDALLRGWAASTDRDVLWFGRSAGAPPRAPGVWWHTDTDAIDWSRGAERLALFNSNDLSLRGAFNRFNAAAAAAAAVRMDVPAAEIREAVRAFRPVEHRLELVLEHGGVEFYNDSIATTPESTIAALEALGRNTLLICGGKTKGMPFDSLARAAARHAKCIFVIGSAADEIARAVQAIPTAPPVDRAGVLEAAVAAAVALANPGDRVLLSPACPSYDQFLNFEERGHRFKALVRELTVERANG